MPKTFDDAIASIDRLADIMEANTSALKELMAKGAGKTSAASGDDAEKPKRGRKPKEDTASGDDESDTGDAADADALKALLKKVAGWVKEFDAAGEDDPENEARRGKLNDVLKKLGVEKVSTVKSEDHRSRLDKWVDKQIEAGRITPDPKKSAAADEDDDEI